MGALYDINDFNSLSLDPPAGPTKGSNQLPRIETRFFVPRLVDKPQNPIMDTLKLASVHTTAPWLPPVLPMELSIIASTPYPQPPPRPKNPNVWYDAMTRNPGIRVCVFVGFHSSNWFL